METAAKASRALVTSTTKLSLIFALATGMLIGTSACGSAPKKNGGETIGGDGRGGPVGPPEPFGPVPPEKKNPYGPEPVQVRSVVLVLGPGAARGFAHAGVIRALNDAKIPVGAILGTEMGALVGSIYTSYPSMNGFEWEIQKLKEPLFLEKKSLLDFDKSPALSDGEKLSDFLERSFGNRDLKDARIPLRMCIREADTDRVALLDRGKLSSSVRAAMAIPVLFEPVSWGSKRVQSATAARPFAVSEARALNRGPVIVVNVISTAKSPVTPSGDFEQEERKVAEQMDLAERAGAAELASADLVIEPDMNGIGFLDFAKRSEAAYRGRAAVQAQLSRLKVLVSPPADPSQDPSTGVAPQ